MVKCVVFLPYGEANIWPIVPPIPYYDPPSYYTQLLFYDEALWSLFIY